MIIWPAFYSGGVQVPGPSAAGVGYDTVRLNSAGTALEFANTTDNLINGFRLGLESGVYVSTTDQIGKTTLYLNSGGRGNIIGLYNGTKWYPKASANISLALGTLVDATNYDVYVYDNAGTLTLDTPVAWLGSGQAITAATNASPIVLSFSTPISAAVNDIVYVSGAKGNTAANGTWVISAITSSTITLSGSTGNGAWTEGGYIQVRDDSSLPVLQDGVYCKTGALTRRYVGTFRTTSTTTTEDSGGYAGTTNVGGKMFLWNMDNRVERPLSVIDTADSWVYTTNTIRQANAAAGNKVEFVCGMGGDPVKARVTSTVSVASQATNGAKVGVGLDSTTVFYGLRASAYNLNASASFQAMTAEFTGNVGPGYHSLNWCEKGGSSTSTFLGDNGAGEGTQSGLVATVWG